MSYRDELSAALARIEALQRQLEAKDSAEVATLRTVNDELRKEIRRLMALHQEALVEIDGLQRKEL